MASTVSVPQRMFASMLVRLGALNERLARDGRKILIEPVEGQFELSPHTLKQTFVARSAAGLFCWACRVAFLTAEQTKHCARWMRCDARFTECVLMFADTLIGETSPLYTRHAEVSTRSLEARFAFDIDDAVAREQIFECVEAIFGETLKYAQTPRERENHPKLSRVLVRAFLDARTKQRAVSDAIAQAVVGYLTKYFDYPAPPTPPRPVLPAARGNVTAPGRIRREIGYGVVDVFPSAVEPPEAEEPPRAKRPKLAGARVPPATSNFAARFHEAAERYQLDAYGELMRNLAPLFTAAATRSDGTLKYCGLAVANYFCNQTVAAPDPMNAQLRRFAGEAVTSATAQCDPVYMAIALKSYDYAAPGVEHKIAAQVRPLTRTTVEKEEALVESARYFAARMHEKNEADAADLNRLTAHRVSAVDCFVSEKFAINIAQDFQNLNPGLSVVIPDGICSVVALRSCQRCMNAFVSNKCHLDVTALPKQDEPGDGSAPLKSAEHPYAISAEGFVAPSEAFARFMFAGAGFCPKLPPRLKTARAPEPALITKAVAEKQHNVKNVQFPLYVAKIDSRWTIEKS